MRTLLTTEQISSLSVLVRDTGNVALKRRVEVLLMYQDGRPTREIAMALSMSESRVRHWRRQFVSKGTGMFLDAHLNTDLMREPAPGGDGVATQPVERIDLSDPSFYINRELSLLQFQRRVLDEARDPDNPLLERLKFLGIVSSNLDEFFMVRVGGLKMQIAAGLGDSTPDAMSPAEQLVEIRAQATELMTELGTLLQTELIPGLDHKGVHIRDYAQLSEKQKGASDSYFHEYIFPVLTPMAFDPGHPFPHISNLSLNLAVMVRRADGRLHFARLKVPKSIPRLIPVKKSSGSVRKDGTVPYNHYFVWVEQVIAANLESLFPGMEIVESHPFRVTRNADTTIQELEASDLLESVEQSVRQRRFGSVVRVSANRSMPSSMRNILLENLKMDKRDAYLFDGPLGLSGLTALATKIDRHDLCDPPFFPKTPKALNPDSGNSIFSAISAENHLLHQPYDSFDPVVGFLESAAKDPDVLAIKQTLYRVGKNSPVVKALLLARENGKQVTVLVELKARFDEESNIEWAKVLEEAGVHVVYGLLGLKTHSKMALIVRQEGSKIRRYVHLSTGNYNAVTAHLYEDIGIFTADDDIGADASDLFNFLTGYSDKRDYRKLLVAPISLRSRMLELIDREIEHQQNGDHGRLIFKMNALVDKGIIERLYRASQAGVEIDLIVRGICCLRPGIPGVSDNIRVRSIVGRFLEHSRVYYFRNRGDKQVFIGSADMMPRNLNRRVELLYPVEDSRLIHRICSEILDVYLADNVKVRWMKADGSYERRPRLPGELAIHAQQHFLALRDTASNE